MKTIIAVILYPFCLTGITIGMWTKYHNEKFIIYSDVAREAWKLAKAVSRIKEKT